MQIKNCHSKQMFALMVKANAYGVGDRKVVKTCTDIVDVFAVATSAEARRIKNLTNKPILILGAVEKCKIDSRFCYSVSSLGEIDYLIKSNQKLNIHIKLNTGMNRYGFSNKTELVCALERIRHSKLVLAGVFTHFASADDFVSVQYRKFLSFVKLIKSFGFKPILHADNSAVAAKFYHNLDMLRIGFDAYLNATNKLAPVVEICTKVLQINNVKQGELVGYDYRYVASKKTKVAVLPVGYADGFDMHLIGFPLSVAGVSCKLVNICMDCMMIDVSNTKIKEGDTIPLLNKQNTLKRYADYLHTSEYEVMAKFSHIRARKQVQT